MSCTFKIAVFLEKNINILSAIIKLLSTFLSFHFKLLFCQRRRINSDNALQSIAVKCRRRASGDHVTTTNSSAAQNAIAGNKNRMKYNTCRGSINE